MAKSIKKVPALKTAAASAKSASWKALPELTESEKELMRLKYETPSPKESHVEKIEEALNAMAILYRVPQNLQGDNFINIIHHYEDVIKKNIEKLVNQ